MTTGEVVVPANEGISSIHFSPDDSIVSTTSWASTVHFYNSSTHENSVSRFFSEPLICSCFVNRRLLLVGGSEGSIFSADCEDQNLSNEPLKCHSSGVSSLSVFPGTNLLLSSSWDQSLCLWDLNNNAMINRMELNERILFASACEENRIVAYGHRNNVFVLDTRNPDTIEKRVSSLGKQIRSFAISKPQNYGWAIGSVDGRVAIEYFGDIKHQAQRFSFSCNRHENEDGKTIVYPVSSLCFHPVTGILATSSCYGNINFWDLQNKRKLTELQSPFNNSVSDMEFSKNGSLLAIAYSYTWEKGEIEHPPDHVLIYSPNIQSTNDPHE